ncbi:hypothetical protein JXM83_00035 [Candidatus Woesearchaeota archaeon]|nr:hypothetical protein [Candidatus Woesearchaeota archaeon]
MKSEVAPFVKQLLGKLEENVAKLEKTKEDNNPRAFNDVKKECFKIHEEIEKLL